jgi:hypothetical protein
VGGEAAARQDSGERGLIQAGAEPASRLRCLGLEGLGGRPVEDLVDVDFFGLARAQHR